MITVTKIFDWHCSHQLENHSGLCKNIHGHTYKLEVEVTGPIHNTKKLTDEGMIVDFATFKKYVKEKVVDKFDHALILNSENGDAELYKLAKQKGWKTLIMPYRTTAENMCIWIYNQLKDIDNLQIIRIRLYETDTSYAEYKVDKNEN